MKQHNLRHYFPNHEVFSGTEFETLLVEIRPLKIKGGGINLITPLDWDFYLKIFMYQVSFLEISSVLCITICQYQLQYLLRIHNIR